MAFVLFSILSSLQKCKWFLYLFEGFAQLQSTQVESCRAENCQHLLPTPLTCYWHSLSEKWLQRGIFSILKDHTEESFATAKMQLPLERRVVAVSHQVQVHCQSGEVRWNNCSSWYMGELRKDGIWTLNKFLHTDCIQSCFVFPYRDLLESAFCSSHPPMASQGHNLAVYRNATKTSFNPPAWIPWWQTWVCSTLWASLGYNRLGSRGGYISSCPTFLRGRYYWSSRKIILSWGHWNLRIERKCFAWALSDRQKGEVGEQ